MSGDAMGSLGTGIFSPLRSTLFRVLWLTNLVSATGTMLQGVGAAWLMTSLAGTPDMVALVQTATQAPILLFALLAGTVADLWDRRWVLLLAQLWTVLVSFALALLYGLGLVTPSISCCSPSSSELARPSLARFKPACASSCRVGSWRRL